MINEEIKMNVKKYRAATTRDALEMIKQELGENALVLETKQVRTGGFLGMRSKMQVEVSAASPTTVAKPESKAPTRSGIKSHQILNLTDYAQTGTKIERRSADLDRQNLIAALSERAASSTDGEKQFLAKPMNADRRPIDTVEVSPDEPRLVYPKKTAPKPILPVKRAVPEYIIENTPPAGPNREMEMLRAEVREVKFSLGAFANRQRSESWQSEVDLDLFGEIFEAPFYDAYVKLTGTGLSNELARKMVADVIPFHKSRPASVEQLPVTTLGLAIPEIVKFEADALLRNKPSILAMIGATGVGKTTTVAKLAATLSLIEHRRVELVTVDTYRIAAVEQLKTYAEIIGAGCHVVRSVFELDEVLRRLSPDATVLIDTTGRNPHDLADQHELSGYLHQHKEIRKCLAMQATTHPIDAAAAINKYEMYGADCLAITKMDETMRPGAVIQTIAESNLPLAYVCAGQRVPEDLQVATVETLTDQILGIRKGYLAAA